MTPRHRIILSIISILCSLLIIAAICLGDLSLLRLFLLFANVLLVGLNLYLIKVNIKWYKLIKSLEGTKTEGII